MRASDAPSAVSVEQAQRVIDLCRAIARFSEEPPCTTRTFLSASTRDVHALLRNRMEALDMEVSLDAAGNLRGLYGGVLPGTARILIGSHIDTVPNAGAFDGVLGVLLALELVKAFAGRRLQFDVEVAAFSEEEGVRFGVPFIGSRALIGTVDHELLSRRDAAGTTVAQAIRSFDLDPLRLDEAVIHPSTFAFLEFHIEQGPVLDDLGLSLGVVDTVVGQSRLEVIFSGHANHAGATPMHLRYDALAAASEWIVLVESHARAKLGAIATVGRINADPNAANVIAGEVSLSLDVRHPVDRERQAVVDALLAAAAEVALRRGLAVRITEQSNQSSVSMHPALVRQIETAVYATGNVPYRMASGAGHDAMVLAAKVPSAILFLRSPGGVSHHPEETVMIEDVRAALDAGLYFLNHLEIPKPAPVGN